MTATTAVTAQPVPSALQAAEEEGLSFAGTPGPGYSEGGDVYEPRAAPKTQG
jgi:hypothetical protein